MGMGEVGGSLFTASPTIALDVHFKGLLNYNPFNTLYVN